jgi:Heterokaryon incompatibility protein (HET)
MCINQTDDDDDEKSDQIPLMAWIYSHESYVIVWLGRPKEDSEFVMDCIRNDQESKFKESRFQAGIMKMLARPWFCCTWVLQEFVLNKTSPQIACGPGPIVIWDDFAKAALQTIKEITSGPGSVLILSVSTLVSFAIMNRLRERYKNQPANEGTMNLRNALSTIRHFHATDLRDRIWAILGLVDQKIREQYRSHFPVDYKNKSVAEVYKDATIYLLKFEKATGVYVDFPVSHDEKLALSSWVPDYKSPF